MIHGLIFTRQIFFLVKKFISIRVHIPSFRHLAVKEHWAVLWSESWTASTCRRRFYGHLQLLSTELHDLLHLLVMAAATQCIQLMAYPTQCRVQSCVFVNWFVTSFLLAVCRVLGKWSHGDKHRDVLVLNMVWSLFRNDIYFTQTMTRTSWNTHVHQSHCFLSCFNLERLKDGGMKWLGETWPVNLLYLSTCLSSPLVPPVKRCRLSAFPR